MKKKVLLLLMSCLLGVSIFTGCTSVGVKSGDSDTLTIVWYPNESGGDLEEARNVVGDVIAEATGKKVEHKLTTDYAIAIESIANGSADISFMGAQGYIEANKKNDKVQPLVVPSGASGTLDDAVYYSWLAVQKENSEEYLKGGEYAIDNIKGKKMSFVSNSSTSGFKVPTSSIKGYFTDDNLSDEDLMEGGSNKFFSEVLYGGSHQGSAVNVLTEKADVAAFCDTVLINYVDAVDGEFNEVGTVYKVKDNADEPFNTLGGEEFVAISSTAVLNSPFVVNTEVVSEEDVEKLVEALTSDEVANNEDIFVIKDSDKKGFFTKTDKERFVVAEDSWFDKIRDLSK